MYLRGSLSTIKSKPLTLDSFFVQFLFLAILVSVHAVNPTFHPSNFHGRRPRLVIIPTLLVHLILIGFIWPARVQQQKEEEMMFFLPWVEHNPLAAAAATPSILRSSNLHNHHQPQPHLHHHKSLMLYSADQYSGRGGEVSLLGSSTARKRGWKKQSNCGISQVAAVDLRRRRLFVHATIV